MSIWGLLAWAVTAWPALAAVVVDEVEPHGRAALVGLRVGDRLVGPSFTRAPWMSPFDVLLARVRQASRGTLSVRAERNGQPFVVTLLVADWGLRTRPDFASADLERYRAGQRQAESGQPQDALLAWRALASDLRARHSRLDAAWLLGRAAELPGHRDQATALALLESARDVLGSGHVWPRSALFDQQGTLLARVQPAAAVDAFRRALALRRRLPANDLLVARSYEELARVQSLQRARPDLALSAWRSCVRLRRRHAPRSLDMALALNGEGSALLLLYDIEGAQQRLRRALSLAERLTPDGPELARMLMNLGICARRRGDVDAAEHDIARSVELFERWTPGTPALGNALNSWALLARERGDWERAEDLFRRALELFERLAPEGAEVPGVLNNLGTLAILREDWEAARLALTGALARRVARAPESLDVVGSLGNLATIARNQGQLDEAQELAERALAMRQRLTPDSPALSTEYEELAHIAIARRDHGAALGWARQAVTRRERLGGALLADALALVARTLAILGHGTEAAVTWRRALALVDTYREQAGGDTAQAGVARRFGDFYRDAAVLLGSSEQPAEALHVLERGRARGLLGLLAQRDLAFREVPASLRRERRRLAASYDSVQEQSRRSDGIAQGAVLARRLRELRAERERLDVELRRLAPRVAALQGTQPLALHGVRSALDAGTALIVFNTQRDLVQTYVVRALGEGRPAGLVVLARPLPERELRDRVLAWRGFIEQGRTDARLTEPLLAQGARLYADLLAPCEPALVGARRLLIVPDGPLHGLPFAALVRQRAPLQYLAEWLPVHTAVSATLYAQLRAARARPRAAAPLLAAFGAALPTSRAGTTLPALPGAAEEVRALAALFPGARVYLGPQASEAQVRALPRGVRYVHFALHAQVDLHVPLDSALVLSPPAKMRPAFDNGLLQSFEVFEDVRLDAELVTLSGCQTGLGREMGGEGLLGLVRAFHYAGARSVLASLWSVFDRSTADIMTRLYGQLARGVSKDEALRQAQLHLLHASGPTSHPFYWAAFQLSGDWR